MNSTQKIFLKFLSFYCFNLCGSSHAHAQQTYFQQKVDYAIHVTLNDIDHTLHATERIQYKNNSPTPLDILYFHLWPNAYKNKKTALFKEFLREGNMQLMNANENERGFIDSLDFKVNGQPIQWQLDSVNIDICQLHLNQTLQPGDSIEITTPFFVKIPDAKFSRLGHVGQSYMITQWFPKPAVYDATGWHPLPYLSQGEFYSEFGSFDVYITAPENYIIAASGELKTESEQKFIADQVEKTTAITSWTKDNSFPTSSSISKTIHFNLQNAHDFAWFADKRFHVLKKVIQLPLSERAISCYAYFTNANPVVWLNAANYISDAVVFYSKQVGEYPYSICTAVDGTISAGGGMEYPTITNIGMVRTPIELDNVITHEIGHNWFYGMLASNERENAWMDEGINSYYESNYMNEKYALQSTNYFADFFGIKPWLIKHFGFDQLNHTDINRLSYLITARQNNDQPIQLSSSFFTPLNYAALVYSKTALCFQYLNHYLGDAEFNAAMQSYFENWKFKHPLPNDLKHSLENHSGKKLDWFFNDFINSTQKTDYKISHIKTATPTGQLYIKNKGTIKVPFSITLTYSNKSETTIWYDGGMSITKIPIPSDSLMRIDLNKNDYMMDINPHDNSKYFGRFKKSNPLNFSLLTKLEKPEKHQLFYLPAIGYNIYNGFMAGIAIHNISFLKKKFEYVVAPLYGFKSSSITGLAYANYTLFAANKIIDRLEFETNPKSFAVDDFNYFSTPFAINFRFKKSPYSPFTEYYFTGSFLNNFFQTKDHEIFKSFSNQFYFAKIKRSNLSKLDPGNINLTLEHGAKYSKIYLTTEKEITIRKMKKAIYMRLFAGDFLVNKRNDGLANFTTSAWSGAKDYLLQGMYASRERGTDVWSKQINVQDGGLKSYYPVGSSKWMIGFNLSVKTPLPLICFYADVATFENAKSITPNSSYIRYDGGLEINIFKNTIAIYFPLFVSKEISAFEKLNNIKYKDRIRFVFDLTKLNPVRLRDSLSR